MRLGLYFDTSVFGGINDVEFQEDSIKLFEMVRIRKSFAFFQTSLKENEPFNVAFSSKRSNLKIIPLPFVCNLKTFFIFAS